MNQPSRMLSRLFCLALVLSTTACHFHGHSCHGYSVRWCAPVRHCR